PRPAVLASTRHTSLRSRVIPPPPRRPLFPYTTLFRSQDAVSWKRTKRLVWVLIGPLFLAGPMLAFLTMGLLYLSSSHLPAYLGTDRKSTRLNSSHRTISYAVFCLKKKTVNQVTVLAES